MKIEDKFASRRQAFLVQQHPKIYVELVRSGKLTEHLEQKGLEARQMMEAVIEQMKHQLDSIQDPQAREIRLAQIELTAEEIALNEIVLTV
jgi:hypothetical protein